ncbi:MAG TPA: family 1 glycosylhydrolase [Pseudoxanthomonas sp.]|jgi:dTDP-4-dehydrorhamnose reductase|nr:family 1 glycosylhydrolase [Pseudoxanthomonas sp.]
MPPTTPLQLWGGLECSVVRVGDAVRDQFRETGHDARGAQDLEAIAALGIKVLRYPVSWERVAPGDPANCDWRWHDGQLAAMRRLGIRPIVGFVHHGGGPRHTSLADPMFPEKLAGFALQAALRYPWVTDWTPVNEPLTTARFSGLYGHWYPHHTDEDSFLRMVANQCRAAMLAMSAIRAVIPEARLVQTEDLGRVFARPSLRKQAAHENERRWLSLDLLQGQVQPGTRWHARLLAAGVPSTHLDALEGGCGAMLLGLNHYVTSDRFLDDRVALYPPNLRGGNGERAYVDTEAARVPLPEGSVGWLPRLREALDRYPGVPAAVTEVHLGCREPEHQVRWLDECWQAASTLRAEGLPMEAITVWSLFGAVDWCSLLRQQRNRYEPGVFDIRGKNGPRPTILAEAVAAYTGQGRFEHTVLHHPGWWRHPERVHPGLRRAS